MRRVLRRGMRGRDVRRWQLALIEWGYLKGRADGIFGPLTEAATIAFQREYHLVPDGKAGPQTLGRAGLLDEPEPQPVEPKPQPVEPEPPTAQPPPTTPPEEPVSPGSRVAVTVALLRRVMPGVKAARGAEYAPFLQQAMQEFGIDTPPRAAAFLAQLAHESGQLRFMEELWGPTRAQRRYEPRSSLAASLGNTQPGDGKRFKGRGPIQLTGRANYRVFGDALGVDLVASPAVAATKEIAFRIAALYWKKRGLNPLADRQNFREITRRINGGFNGWIDRVRFFERAKRIFDVRALARGMPRLEQAEDAPDPRFSRGLDGPGEITPTAAERSAPVPGRRGAGARTAPAARRAPGRSAARTGPRKKTAAKKARTTRAKAKPTRARSTRTRASRSGRARSATTKSRSTRAKKSTRTRKPATTARSRARKR